MTYDRDRVVRRAGRIAPETQRAIDRALGMHLGLAPIYRLRVATAVTGSRRGEPRSAGMG